MITASQIAELRTSSINFRETEELKARFARLRTERAPFYLTGAEFDEVLRWKLRDQYGGQRPIREANTDEILRAVTGFALAVTHNDPDYQLELRTHILCALRGVGVPVASGVLSLVYPDEYAVIETRVWRQFFDEVRRMFSVANYRRYMGAVRGLAKELGWPVQEVGLAVWEYDRRQGQPD